MPESAVARAAAFVALLASLFLVAIGVGRLVGPVDVQASSGQMEHSGEDSDERGDDHDDAAGYRMVLDQTRLGPGTQPVAFTIAGELGPLTSYDVAHEKQLHLIVVQRDLTGFQHLHPTLDPDTGVWTTDVALEPGAWRLYADFVPADGEQTVLSADLVVEGAGTQQPLGEDVLGASVDGYDVTLGVATDAGVETRAIATVMRDGEPVTDLGTYLGEPGHLVVLRDGDLAYVHGHPADSTTTGPTIPFDITFPTAGRYRLFLEFEHDGAVHTAAFTVTVEGGDGLDHSDEHSDEHGEGDHDH